MVEVEIDTQKVKMKMVVKAEDMVVVVVVSYNKTCDVGIYVIDGCKKIRPLHRILSASVMRKCSQLAGHIH